VNRFGAIAIAYEVDVRMMKEPANTVNAVSLPNGIAPRHKDTNAQSSVAGIGQLSSSLTLEKNFGKGVALSRASDHQMRLQVRSVPTRQMRSEKKTMARRQKVPPLVPVAWWYMAARGKEPLLLTTASRSVME
jgi:hypothetical protein